MAVSNKMLEPWIIEEVLKRRKQTSHGDRPFVEMPYLPYDDEPPAGDVPQDKDRGVAIISFSV